MALSERTLSLFRDFLANYSMPSLRSIAQFALGASQATALLGSSHGASCPNPQLSCHNTTVIENTCCFNSPGGQMLQTQFWDTGSHRTGPDDSWTIHGLWPDLCDGSYEQFCDRSRQYKNITGILNAYKRYDLLEYMDTYWKDYKGNDEYLWEHEWSKHGTCVSTLKPSCYPDYVAQEEVVEFFEKTTQLFQGLDTYKVLSDAGIVPSRTARYNLVDIQSALTNFFGYQVSLGCHSGQLEEVWYHFNVRGSVQTGEFVPTSPDGGKSTCPSRGIRYLPK